MIKFFENWKAVTYALCFSTLLFILIGFLGNGSFWTISRLPEFFTIRVEPTVGSLLGIGAFSVVPMSLCLFGLGAFNEMYFRFAPYLNPEDREDLSKKIDSKYLNCQILAFLSITLQTISSLILLLPDYVTRMALLCALFNSIVCVMLYGLFVCENVRTETKVGEKFLNKELIKDKRNKQGLEVQEQVSKLFRAEK